MSQFKPNTLTKIQFVHNIHSHLVNIKKNLGFYLGCFSTISLLACSQPTKKNNDTGYELFRTNFSPTEVTESCDRLISEFQQKIEGISLPSKGPISFTESFEHLENISSDFDDKVSPLTFLYNISTQADVRLASQNCDSKVSKISIEMFSNRKLYQKMKAAQKSISINKLSASQKRLISETMKAFRLNGLELPDDKLQKFKAINQQLADLNNQFHANLNNNTDFAEMNLNELQGVPETVRSRFEKLPNGNYKIPAKATYYIAFMENAENSLARKKMLSVYDNREADKNTALLQKAVQLRREGAKLAGFKDWADYKTYNKMAKSGKNAWDFLQGLKSRLKKSYQKDYDQLLAFKRELDPKANKVDAWDGAYLSNQLKKKRYAVDDEVLREYFPADHVIKKMLEIYSTLLKVDFEEIPNAIVWHPSVKLFSIKDANSNEILAHFYMDMYPREGKYSHAAAFPLKNGRRLGNQYEKPIAAIVANLTPPTNSQPSLLSHDDVETLFHEFGHIMHITLTKAEYSSLSGVRVAWDFVEAPSQMLENWVWEPSILKQISANYKEPNKPLPDDLIEKLVSSRKFNRAWVATRQLVFGIFDLTLHRSQKDIDVTQTYVKTFRELTNQDPIENTHFPASFGHLMGGYDAGYYGYLWSNVFAMDMFTLFKNGKLLSSEVGYKYRTAILEKGNTKDADLLLQDFLGRKPNSKAFFEFLGL